MRLTLLSLGAGVQSTTLALMAANGVLPKPDAAIFADTGWEPAAVYHHLNRLEKVLGDAAIPLHRVSRGDLREDVLSPYAQAGIPYFTLGPLRREVVIDESRPCPAMCGWAEYLSLDLWEDEELDLEEPAACEGCGSTGEIVVRSHVEWRRGKGMGSRRCTGRYKVEPIERQVRRLLGAEVSIVPCRFCEASGMRVPPWDAAAGLGPCSVCRGSSERQLVGPVPAGNTAVQWIGFSTDEVHRVGSRFPSYITAEYPLLKLGMSREDCQRWLSEHGWDQVVKSACIACPFHGNAAWRALRDTCQCGHDNADHYDRLGFWPRVNDTAGRGVGRCANCDCEAFDAPEWEDAVGFDRAFRSGRGMTAQRYLHESRVPLDQAPIDRQTRADRRGEQLDLLAELGDPDGCSPYGCRSGEPVPRLH